MKITARRSHGGMQRRSYIVARLILTLCSLMSFLLASGAGSHWR